MKISVMELLDVQREAAEKVMTVGNARYHELERALLERLGALRARLHPSDATFRADEVLAMLDSVDPRPLPVDPALSGRFPTMHRGGPVSGGGK